MAGKKKQNSDQTGPAYTVVSQFRSIEDFDTILEPGDDVSDFEESRLAELVELGLVEFSEPAQ